MLACDCGAAPSIRRPTGGFTGVAPSVSPCLRGKPFSPYSRFTGGRYFVSNSIRSALLLALLLQLDLVGALRGSHAVRHVT
jgi:hypothetical protein